MAWRMIREFAPSDLNDLTALFAAIPQAAHWSARDVSELLSSGARVWVDERDGQIAGAVAVRCMAGEGEILNLAVRKIWREQGIGRALMKIAMKYAETEGVHRFFLEVRESNSDAQKFYMRMGFTGNGRRKKYYNDPAEDALLLSRVIK
jgi:ribosomal-protein-alanine N-acetyltransferase